MIPIKNTQPRKMLNSKVLFITLQACDLLTTVGCFHFGLVEKNPVNVYMIGALGPTMGLLVSKLLVCAVVLPITLSLRQSLTIPNVIYSGVVMWNLLLVSLLTLARTRVIPMFMFWFVHQVGHIR
jgi:hypothetical protein